MTCDHFKPWIVEATGQSAESSAPDLIKALRRLFQAEHPDRNGSTALATQRAQEVSQLIEIARDADALERCRRSKCKAAGGQNPEPTLDDLFGAGATTYPVQDEQPDVVEPEPVPGVDRREYVEISAELAASGGHMELGRQLGLGTRLTFKIPPNCADRKVFKFKARGYSGAGGGKAGDLYVEVRIKQPKPGADISVSLRVSFGLARDGGTAQLTYVQQGEERTVEVSIPAGAKSGFLTAIVGLGELGEPGGKPGNLLISVAVDEPLRGSDIHKQLPVAAWQVPLRHLESIAYERDGYTHAEPNLVVPAGVRSGQVLRYAGLGGLGDLPGTRGDLMLTVVLDGSKPGPAWIGHDPVSERWQIAG